MINVGQFIHRCPKCFCQNSAKIIEILSYEEIKDKRRKLYGWEKANVKVLCNSCEQESKTIAANNLYGY